MKKEMLAAMLRSAWPFVMPSAKPGAEKEVWAGTAQVDRFDAADIKDVVCVRMICCSLVSHV